MNQVTIDVHLNGQEPSQLLAEIRRGLLRTPRELPTKYFYDDRGSELFERICELPEYYQTRTEYQLLTDIADELAELTKAQELVDIGAGAATKTRVLLSAMARAKRLRVYIPFDVSEGITRRIAEELANEYEGLQVHGIVGDFLEHLEHIPSGNNRLVVLLGGTIGNLRPDAASAFLSTVCSEMATAEYLLLGVDLIKDVKRLEAAYNDSAGVTADFNKNILQVMQSMLGDKLDGDAFEHRAVYNPDQHRIEMWLRSLHQQTVHLPSLDLTLDLAKDEEILTEVSVKYDREKAEAVLGKSGFRTVDWYTDPERLFGLALAQKA
ncbi:MAG: L-histidine N(alpha)-methyltransferase [Nitrospiraceae bacterium]